MVRLLDKWTLFDATSEPTVAACHAMYAIPKSA